MTNLQYLLVGEEYDKQLRRSKKGFGATQKALVPRKRLALLGGIRRHVETDLTFLKARKKNEGPFFAPQMSPGNSRTALNSAKLLTAFVLQKVHNFHAEMHK